MPFGSVTLIPGVNVERTPTLLQAAISNSQLVRFRDGLVQKFGGWQKYYNINFAGVIRELGAWQDLNNAQHVLVGSTKSLAVVTNNVSKDITPQIATTNFTPVFTATTGSPMITVTDSNVTGVTIYDSVFFNTPISVGGVILSGLYPVAVALGGSSYEINAGMNAASNTTGGAVPVFSTATGSFLVNVALATNSVATGNTVVFPVSTFNSTSGITVFGDYSAVSIIDVNDFDIAVPNQATTNATFAMNGGLCQLLYYIAFAPVPPGAGWGSGGYGVGGYGLGTTGGAQVGTTIVVTDWTSGNWGEIELACPAGGGVYQFDPTGAFTNAQLVNNAPTFNGGIFISNSQQILVCWGASVKVGLGVAADPLRVTWSTIGDYTTFTPLVTNQAGSFRIPTGSKIVAGMAVANQDLIWTDLDFWSMNYQGPPFVFGFNLIGAGAGAISSHSVQKLRGGVYWMGMSNFYSFAPGGGVQVMPCPVWDFVFQNLNQNFTQNVRAMANTNFNEAGWLFPSALSTTGECDSYVKFNITEQGTPWDSGTLSRSAWLDESIVGNPLAASGGTVYQHETTNDADGSALNSSFTTGYFYIAEGEEFAFVDQIMPDFKWGFFGAPQTAQVQLTFNVINFPGDTPTVFGPFTVTQSTQYLIVRFRGRQMSITVVSNQVGSFYRIGKVRYRYTTSGRR